MTYNRNTGLVRTSTNENGQVTNYDYEPDTLRPKKTTYPNLGYTETFYSDKEISNPADLVIGYSRQKTKLEDNKFAESYGYFDGRGLGIRSASKTPDGWSVSAVEHDHLGRARKSYNPFYATVPNGAVPAGTKFTEVVNYDALGRTTNKKMGSGVRFCDFFAFDVEFRGYGEEAASLPIRLVSRFKYLRTG